ncbi:MAG: acetyl/propionyl/methylcrotonyl-CoA carboxylase subunit alpha [Alphaproteobacteria bacterium]|nr:acetyl/propionyl/methylcrotonyl-CoA carboxylase subunit alpha [Alphaproteobacteria bacterium]
MFKKILIANRGEIACRVIRTARRMGIKTVAVYSEADADALHVEMADQAVLIGPAPSAESYLVIDRILEAIKKTKAQAVHPGYGFLSENQTFAEALDAAGVAFIGPGAEAIAVMGDKIQSKKLAKKAKVNTIPGTPGAIKSPADALKAAKAIGFPVMLKASAGGGGKGMRIARHADEVEEGFRSARNEAQTAFGDDRVFVEKFIEEPRHIEIQVLADGHGNVIHLGERECSIQRRHQKVIEEAPSPFLDPQTRAAMGAQAVALARAVDYRSAGTVEFIVDKDRNFYFLEMNTRLQVEHPVTEYVTGLDLVEQMIRVAAGEKLAIRQEDIELEGWAIEARVYAEDPFRGFMPSIGRLTHFQTPDPSGTVRVDTGVQEGGEISMFYDPMIAKLITFGADRAQAISRMRHALDGFHIRGVSHNISFLAALVAHPRFVEGRLTTNFIAEEYPDGFSGADLPHDDTATMVAVAATIDRLRRARDATISGQMPGRRRTPAGAGREDWVVCLGTEQHAVSLTRETDGYDVNYAGRTYAVRTDWRLGEPLFRGTVNGREICVQVDRRGAAYRLFHAGSESNVQVLTPAGARLAALMPEKAPADTSKYLLSPMPGLLSSVAVAPGQQVKAGQELAVVEAMKMENILRAERDATVIRLHAEPGDSLAVDQAILEFD